MKLLKVEYGGFGNVREEYWLRPDGKITVRRVQDADPILNANKQQFNAKSAKASKLNDGPMTQVARIPFGLVEEILMKTGVNVMTCPEWQLKKLLNSSEYAKLRTAHGRI